MSSRCFHKNWAYKLIPNTQLAARVCEDCRHQLELVSAQYVTKRIAAGDLQPTPRKEAPSV